MVFKLLREADFFGNYWFSDLNLGANMGQKGCTPFGAPPPLFRSLVFFGLLAPPGPNLARIWSQLSLNLAPGWWTAVVRFMSCINIHVRLIFIMQQHFDLNIFGSVYWFWQSAQVASYVWTASLFVLVVLLILSIVVDVLVVVLLLCGVVCMLSFYLVEGTATYN